MPQELDPTVQSFPSYAELTQTQAWGKQAAPVRADTQDAEKRVEVSRGRRYTEGPVLGVGGMGKVVLAQDARIGREVAVKVLHAERELEPPERARFLREAQVQGQLEHPSIVPVYDIDRREDGTTFFTMRRVLGRTLGAIIEDLRAGVPAAKQRYTERELLTAFSTVCLAIDYAHSRGVVHRDLKPANIMLGDFGEVYVLDWGLARLLDETGGSKDHPDQRLSVPGAFLGTPMYMAPEQMVDPDVTGAADVFALGMILFEILTLERARDPNALYAPVDARPRARTPYRNIAPELETICVKATETDAADRYPSPRAMQEAISAYLEGDRELAQRRQLAAGHAKSARAALDQAQAAPDPERERTRAIHELVRALALDPTGDDNVSMLGEILATPPRTLPAEVHQELRNETQRMVRSGARHAFVAVLSWFAFLPILLWIGVEEPLGLTAIAVPAGLSGIASAFALRQRHIGKPVQYATIIFMMIAAAGLSSMYGPLVLMPTMIATYAIVLQAHPSGTFRRVTAVLAVITMLVPVVLEVGGIIPSAYTFEAGRWIIESHILQLPRAGTLTFLTLANMAMVIVPCFFIARLRAELSAAQQHQLVQAWHFKRLGADLVGARAAG
jgi:serine/threonine protein kinase